MMMAMGDTTQMVSSLQEVCKPHPVGTIFSEPSYSYSSHYLSCISLPTSLVHLSLYCCILDLASRACISPCIISRNLSHTTSLSVVFPASLPAPYAYSTSLVPLSSPTYWVDINFQYIVLQITTLSRIVRKWPRPPSCLRVPGNLIPTNLPPPINCQADGRRLDRILQPGRSHEYQVPRIGAYTLNNRQKSHCWQKWHHHFQKCTCGHIKRAPSGYLQLARGYLPNVRDCQAIPAWAL
jgi:hypothetical protein